MQPIIDQRSHTNHKIAQPRSEHLEITTDFEQMKPKIPRNRKSKGESLNNEHENYLCN
uniref:Uncharacterized protein n=1 Tax=Arundo donax TaxID=35708 RepID=A0A0A9H7I5_ARUDO